MKIFRQPLRVSLAGIVGAFLSMGALPLVTHAAVIPDPNECRFEAQFDEIAAIRANTFLTYSDQILQELAVRKEIIRKTLSCATRDATALKEKVDAVDSSDQSVQALRISFVSQLNAARDYYANEEGKIDTLGIQGSKDLARNLREWRTNTYAPMAEQALHFLVWEKNQELFTAAMNRSLEIERSVASLNLLESENIAPLIAAARNDLRDASAQNNEAQNVLEAFPPKTNALDVIKKSLEKLARTYEDFYKVSEAVQNLLPGAAEK